MRTRFDQSGDRLRVSLSGELDHHYSLQVRREMDAAIDENRPRMVELDLSGLSFMDSSGIGVVLGRYKKLKAMGGQMCVVNVPAKVDKIFQMSGLYTLIPRA